MATHDYIIANASGSAVRADLNNALAAIVSNNSSATEPATTYPFMWWADTTASQLKLRNSTNTDWVVIQELDGTMLMEDGTAAAPGLSFASDTNTGLFSGGADKLGVTAGGVERAEFGTTEVVFNDSGADVDFRVEGDTEANLLFVDAGNDRVGIGTNTPDATLNVSLAATDTSVYFHGGGSRGLKINDDTISNDGDHTKFTKTSTTGEYSFSNSSLEIIRFSSDGNVGIGATTPDYRLQIGDGTASTSNVLKFGKRVTSSQTNLPLIGHTSADGGASDLGLCATSGTGSIRFYTGNGIAGFGDSDNDERVAIKSDGVVEIVGSEVVLQGNEIGGTQVTIADDGFATITPPRIGGGWVFITTQGHNASPHPNAYGRAFVDWGSSPAVNVATGGTAFETSTSGPPTGTTGSDAHATLFAGGTSGKIYLENRLGGAKTFQITFL